MSKLNNFVIKLSALLENKKVSYIWDFCTLLFVFYVQSDSMLFSLNEKMRVVEFLLLFVLFALNFLRNILLKRKIFTFSDSFFKRSLIFVALFAISFLFNFNNSFNIHRYLIQAANIALSYLLVLSLDLKNLKKDYLFIITVFAFFSLLFFIPYFFNDNFYSFFPVVTNSNDYKFYFTGFSSLLVRTRSGMVKRNYGIFREPGVYGVFLVFGLILTSFGNITFKKKDTLIKTIFAFILTATILSTLSTTTIIAAGLVLIAKFLTTKTRVIGETFKIVSIGLIAIFGVVVLIYPSLLKPIPFLYNVFGKFSFANDSFVSRFFDTIATFFAFLLNPIFGVGFGGLHNSLSSIANSFNFPTNGGINSLLQVFAVHGIAIGVIVSYYMFCFFRKIINRNNYAFIFGFFAFLLCIFNEDLCNSFFFFFLVFIGMKIKHNKYLRNNQEIFICVGI